MTHFVYMLPWLQDLTIFSNGSVHVSVQVTFFEN